ncbi:phospholipid/cholesterol/gamma-HCH transport system substrate-binding protein [Tamaricihabitans halophyticus]|uniref:Phospholipid/cholesterol/gamma-HCH transport system substrate-binding protein n=1 Tax=Tamaricihabitans halophyticus TaxID=1262583 RepID=A0A4R2QTZ3_9PSEU|nr:MlaD family protein [Tamaricihabitans halophyticus]TCP53187.1 phospholipid/cholesterol/gamma-HCH transport system substrate-binding protein [Tamaricihabitans halophyticus]
MRSLASPLIKFLVFVAVTIFATAVLGITIANAQLGSVQPYSARFTDASQLLPGDDVRIAGVRVGQVSDVKVVDRAQAMIEFEVDDRRTLPSGVTATIKYRNLIGQRYLSLEQGAAGDPNDTLEPGETIPLEQTTPALDLTELFNGFKPLFRALSPEDVNKLSYEIIQVLQGEGGTVENLLKHTASLTTTIAEKDQVIGEVIGNLNEVLDTVNARGPELSRLIVRLQELVSGLAQDREPIGEAIESLGGLADSTSGLLEEGRAPLKESIRGLSDLSQNLNDSEPTVEHFIQFLPEKAERLTRTASYGSWFNFYLCEMDATVGGAGLPDIPLPLMPTTQSRCQG